MNFNLLPDYSSHSAEIVSWMQDYYYKYREFQYFMLFLASKPGNRNESKPGNRNALKPDNRDESKPDNRNYIDFNIEKGKKWLLQVKN